MHEDGYHHKDEIQDSIDELENINQIYSEAVLFKIVKLREEQMKNRKNQRNFLQEHMGYI